MGQFFDEKSFDVIQGSIFTRRIIFTETCLPHLFYEYDNQICFAKNFAYRFSRVLLHFHDVVKNSLLSILIID